MDVTNPLTYLDPSPLIDSRHPDIVALAVSLAAGATNDAERAVRLHDFVRDHVAFGWAPAFDRQRASEVLQSRIGFCNTKTTLLVALLRAAGIPARIHVVTINREILSGLIRPPTLFVDHSYAEVRLQGRWMGIDSYIVDAPLHHAAVVRCRNERRLVGYGVSVNGSIAWDGRSDCFAQFVNDGSVKNLSDEAFGSFRDFDDFRVTRRGRNPSNPLARLVVRWMTRSANRRVTELRQAG